VSLCLRAVRRVRILRIWIRGMLCRVGGGISRLIEDEMKLGG